MLSPGWKTIINFLLPQALRLTRSERKSWMRCAMVGQTLHPGTTVAVVSCIRTSHHNQ